MKKKELNKLIELAKEHGVLVQKSEQFNDVAYHMDAPQGKILTYNGTHTIVATEEEAISVLEAGLSECETHDCEWCEDADPNNYAIVHEVIYNPKEPK